MSSIDNQSLPPNTSLAIHDEYLDNSPKMIERATGASVRKILWASLTRTRNLAALGTACVSALVLAGLGFSWFGLAAVGAGMALYSSLIARDALNDDFLCDLFSIGEAAEEEPPQLVSDAPLYFEELDEHLRQAYEAVLSRKRELQRLLANGPSVLQATLREGNRICESLVTSAQCLARRGQRLRGYLRRTKLSELSKSACEAVIQIESTNDKVAADTYLQIVSGRQRHMETHIEVEGLYERVLAQLVLIETTLAGTVAKIVKITATDDEESSLTASLVNEQLEILISDVSILETSLDQVSRAQPQESEAQETQASFRRETLLSY